MLKGDWKQWTSLTDRCWSDMWHDVGHKLLTQPTPTHCKYCEGVLFVHKRDRNRVGNCRTSCYSTSNWTNHHVQKGHPAVPCTLLSLYFFLKPIQWNQMNPLQPRTNAKPALLSSWAMLFLLWDWMGGSTSLKIPPSSHASWCILRERSIQRESPFVMIVMLVCGSIGFKFHVWCWSLWKNLPGWVLMKFWCVILRDY